MRTGQLRGAAAALAVAVLILLGSAARARDDKDKDKLDLGKIPKKVMDALKAKFPKAKIHKWTKEKQGDETFYDIEFKDGGKKAEADIREDGTIINYEKELAAKDLPAAVTKAVEKLYPDAKIKEVMEITEIKDGKESHGGYEITLETAGKKAVEVTVAKDGKVLEDSGAKKDKDKDKE